MSDEKILAWHFVGERLRDGRPVPPDGQLLVHVGPAELYRCGLHASPLLRDAVRDRGQFLRVPTLCRVEVGDVVARDASRLVCRERRILWRIDATEILNDIASRCLWQLRYVHNVYAAIAYRAAFSDEDTAGGRAYTAFSNAAWALEREAGGDPLGRASDAWLSAVDEQNAWLEAAAERVHAGTYETWTPAQETNQAATTVATAVPTAERSE